MKKLIIQVNHTLKFDDLLRFEDEVKKSLDTNGFAVIDNTCTVYEIDDGKEEPDGEL